MTQRDFHFVSLVLVVLGFVPLSKLRAEDSREVLSPVVVIHGAWGGAHHWKAFADDLREKTGCEVHRVALTGLGPKSHLLSKEIALSTHIQDAVSQIEFDELQEVILIGHSYGGLVAQGVVDRLPDRIAEVVYMDSHLQRSGECYLDGHPDLAAGLGRLAEEEGEGWFLPVTWDNSVRDTPHPYRTLTDKLELKADFAKGVKSHYWLFADGKPPEEDPCYRYIERAHELGYASEIFAWRHNPQRSRPGELADAFIKYVWNPKPLQIPEPESVSIDFNRHIRPILSDKCYFCHGPDEAERQADLRLDVGEHALDAIQSGEFMSRVLEHDEDLRMPPVESKLSLSEEEKALLQQWVDSGAEYAGHWAFELLPEEVAVPEIADSSDPEHTDWPRNEIDFFVIATHDSQGLSPNKPASPRRWLRRVTLDLLGLPPTQEQIAAFETRLSEDPDTAYEMTVDSLLDLPSYGEHMAVGWLDVARYADSYGYQSDKLNTQWPYRDWVIHAFNSNLPYNKFLTWQLAGDLLESPTRDQRLATAFNRIHRLNNEGGAVFEEWRIENVADRVHTFGTAVLGLTLECCRCHDHKYDPISTREYYSLAAFFNSIDESGVYDRTAKVPCPSMLLPTQEQEDDLERAQQAYALALETYERTVVEAEPRWKQWKEELAKDASRRAALELPDSRLALSFDRKFDNALKTIYHPSQSDRSWTTPVELVEVGQCSVPRLRPELAADLKDFESEEEPPRLAMRLDGERGVTTEGIEPFDRWAGFTVAMTIRDTKRVARRCILAHHTRGTDCGYNGWDFAITNGHLDVRLGRVWPGNAISVRSVEAIPQDQWCQIATTYDGSSKANGIRLYVNGVEWKTETIRDAVKKSANVKVDHGGQFVVGQRFRDRGFDGGLVDDVRVFERMLTESELRHLATGEPLEPTFAYFVSAIDEQTRAARDALESASQAVVMAEEAMVEISIMQESTRRETHVLARGQYDAPRSEDTVVQRDTIQACGLELPEDARDRLGLARWVTHPRHPLTARVAVNRIWGNFFADPLVRTPENFGSQGELPTHPELLDWLARDFVEHDWNVKRLCKLIVLSSTYRQDSRADANTVQSDPENRWLARGPAYRLSAEQIRDLALHASNLLNAEIGGPPVSPYQPGEDLWRESNGMSPAYQQSVGKSLYRRSSYSVWKRTVPLPNMMALDATTREVCTVKRARTNTPLQALVLLNDTQFVEAARALAQLALTKETPRSQVEFAFERCTARIPTAEELEVLVNLLASEREHFASHQEDAEQLIRIGEHPVGDASAVELAAMTVVCQSILNLDATIWTR